MPGYLCEECQRTVPSARYCPECGSPSPGEVAAIEGVDDNEMGKHFSEIATDAPHESVSFHNLRSRHESYDKPLGGYLRRDERPEFICELKKCTVETVEGSSWKISAGVLDSGHLLITDERVLALFPRDGEAQLVEVPLTETVGVDRSSSWRSDKLVVTDLQGYQYEFALDTDQETFETAARTAEDLNESVDSEESSAAKFHDEIDAEIADADDAESALYAVAALFGKRSEETHLDQVVAESDSMAELGQQIAAMPGIGDSQPETSESASTTQLAKPSVDVTGLRQRLARSASNADPKDVGKYSLGAVLGFGTAAVSAPFSTTAGIAALLAGGAATGAYASANPQSLAARIEPLQLAVNAKDRSSQLASTPGAGSHGAGATLGTAEYLSQMNHGDLDEAYAKWLSEVDIEAVIEGQKMATRYVGQAGEFDDPQRAGLLGGAAGLAYGYAESGEATDERIDGDVVDGLLDDTDDRES
ncbi:zinc ribbon domain-containing protein [Haloarcula nitratireducens]|uniref:Zinc ribbon domain-containing protein n=1 Tax=Haloarcula nitratireducens TaxID=2487749 RepID=A0AAW4P9V9_9EURY|nr:zinc ribbon domain-containing protein [Halomicroarcula nitratireducens]MBX0294290.1 hypothetical protein [Halomicroarcula nitratireducens]